MWHEGTIGIPTDKNNGARLAHFWLKTADGPIDLGIDGGRIIRLRIQMDGITVADYENGWKVEPDFTIAETARAYEIITNHYN